MEKLSKMTTLDLSQPTSFKFKGKLHAITVLQLFDHDYQLFEEQLLKNITQAPKLFYNTPIILDCSTLLNFNKLDLSKFCQCLRNHHILPIAIYDSHPQLSHEALQLNLALLQPSAIKNKIAATTTINNSTMPTKLLTHQIRSGQQITNHGDLIITSSVSNGAELLADGNIHVYGVLRGRALAGIAGNQDARIFCLELAAELVSIAGFYRLLDSQQPGPCQIFLQHEEIVIELLC